MVDVQWKNVQSRNKNNELHLLLPFEQLQFVRGFTLQGVESVPQRCWPVLTPMLPKVVSSWLDVLWVVDHSWYRSETVECEKPSSVAVHGTLKPVHLAPTTIHCSKVLKYFVLAIHPLNGTRTYTIHVTIVSRLKHRYLTFFLTFIYTDWSGFIRRHK